LNNSEFQHQRNRAESRAVNPAWRLIGACCGAFFLCFVALLFSFFQIDRLGIPGATMLGYGALIGGAVGGFLFPRVGHFLGYGFLVFVNLMLALTIGQNPKQQITLFVIFAFIEILFFMSRRWVSREI
jgi:hypothetical protein